MLWFGEELRVENLLSEADRKWADEQLDDVRVIDTDHFVIFRHPEVVAS